jgi:nucleoside-diphosphate-sugar epimerase
MTVTDGRRRVLVAGASAPIGVRRVPRLVGAGYDVAGLTRTPASGERPRLVAAWLGSGAA